MSMGDSDSGIVGMAWVFETEGKVGQFVNQLNLGNEERV